MAVETFESALPSLVCRSIAPRGIPSDLCAQPRNPDEVDSAMSPRRRILRRSGVVPDLFPPARNPNDETPATGSTRGALALRDLEWTLPTSTGAPLVARNSSRARHPQPVDLTVAHRVSRERADSTAWRTCRTIGGRVVRRGRRRRWRAGNRSGVKDGDLPSARLD